MRCRVVSKLPLVVTLGHHNPLMQYDRADGHVAVRGRGRCLQQGNGHRLFVGHQVVTFHMAVEAGTHCIVVELFLRSQHRSGGAGAVRSTCSCRSEPEPVTLT